MLIRKVWKRSKTGQLLVTIPRGSGIQVGDYVKVTKVKE